MAAGPVGAAVGAVGGAIAGAMTEKAMHGDEGHEHVEGDELHYRDDHSCTGTSCSHDHSFHYDYASTGAASGRAVGTEDAETIRLREEELRAETRPVQAGEVQIGKRVVREQQTIDVPVTREEVVIERRPVERRVADSADIGEGETEIRVPVMEEQVEVDKRAVVTEELRVGKRQIGETERVSDTVRREELVVDREGDVEVRDRDRR
jgi:uncharacterized protein (TIGR02271 family)